ncbi:unnamed protein product [Merluccius merluccius]
MDGRRGGETLTLQDGRSGGGGGGAAPVTALYRHRANTGIMETKQNKTEPSDDDTSFQRRQKQQPPPPPPQSSRNRAGRCRCCKLL